MKNFLRFSSLIFCHSSLNLNSSLLASVDFSGAALWKSNGEDMNASTSAASLLYFGTPTGLYTSDITETTATLSPGLYVLQIITTNGIMSEKISVVRR